MLRFIAVFVGIACLAGCTSPPVQEMSDARQAIAAARVAGATEVTSQEYTRARLAALEAKHHAGDALNGVQRTEAQNAVAQHTAPHADSAPAQPH
jgi:hypothetical protein